MRSPLFIDLTIPGVNTKVSFQAFGRGSSSQLTMIGAIHNGASVQPASAADADRLIGWLTTWKTQHESVESKVEELLQG